MIISTNMPALRVHNSLTRTSRRSNASMERLSTGLRINSASDDPSGLATANRMRRQISGISAVSQNALDATSVIQTADSALSEVHSMLQRMRELTVQASNGTMNLEDRAHIQAEINQLIEEIDSIGRTTTFNNKPLFAGSFVANVVGNSEISAPSWWNGFWPPITWPPEGGLPEVADADGIWPPAVWPPVDPDYISAPDWWAGGNDTWPPDTWPPYGTPEDGIDLGADSTPPTWWAGGDWPPTDVTFPPDSDAPPNVWPAVTVSAPPWWNETTGGEWPPATWPPDGGFPDPGVTPPIVWPPVPVVPSAPPWWAGGNATWPPASWPPDGGLPPLNATPPNVWPPVPDSFISAPPWWNETAGGYWPPAVWPPYGTPEEGIDLNDGSIPPAWWDGGDWPPTDVNFPLDSDYPPPNVWPPIDPDFVSAPAWWTGAWPPAVWPPAGGFPPANEAPPAVWPLVEEESVQHVHGRIMVRTGVNKDGTMYMNFPEVSTRVLGTEEFPIRDLSVTESEEGMVEAFAALDNAIHQISSARATLGAYENRLTYTSSVLGATGINMESALSRMVDVDMALEMSHMTLQSVLSQAGMAILAQANQRPQQILQFLN